MRMSIIYEKYHPDWSVLFWIEFFYQICRIINIIMLTYLLYKIISIYYRISTGKIRISVWHEYLEGLLREPGAIFVQLFHIDVYYNNDNDRNRDQDRFQNIYKNLHFCLVCNPRNSSESDTIDNANTQLSIEPPTSTCSLACTIEEYIPTEQLLPVNQNSIVLEQSISSSEHGFVLKNINEIDQRFICQSCKLVLREPYQLICGHRKCQLCLHLQNNIIHCLECSKTSTTNEVWLEKGFRNELESLSAVCTDCDWRGPLKTYQDHRNQNHLNEFILCYICAEHIERNQIHEHYLNETHQRVLSNILLHLCTKQMKNDQQQKMTLSKINDITSILSNNATAMGNNIRQIDNELCSHQKSIEVHIQEFPLVKELVKDNERFLNGMRAAYDISGQEIESLKHRSEDGYVISFDGSLTWKINDVEQNIYDAKFERQKSIYSPKFYSSPVGYKMRARLFLNGVNDSRGKHLSIFFILMRGEYDILLRWPFTYKVTFTLLDQSTSEDNQHHYSDFFSSNIRSKCFQQPQLEMNEAYGIENFISLEQFRQNQHRYVHNDIMFIKVEVDFTSISSDLPLDSGRMLLNDEQHTDTNDDDSMRRFLFMMESSNRVQ